MLRQMKVTIMGQDVDNFSEGEKRINIIRMELHTEPLACLMKQSYPLPLLLRVKSDHRIWEVLNLHLERVRTPD